jgi:hypothetical protein
MYTGQCKNLHSYVYITSYIILYYIILYYIILYYIILYYITLHYITLHYITYILMNVEYSLSFLVTELCDRIKNKALYVLYSFVYAILTFQVSKIF